MGIYKQLTSQPEIIPRLRKKRKTSIVCYMLSCLKTKFLLVNGHPPFFGVQ